MENPKSKRFLSHAIEPQQFASHQTPDSASLATLGMRIRKAVSEGYQVNSPNSYNSQYSAPVQHSAFERVSLPANMSQPPSLTSAGSTFQSGSNVSEWGTPSMNLTTIPSFESGNKRKFDSDEPEIRHPSFEEYSARHGRLQFDEDF